MLSSMAYKHRNFVPVGAYYSTVRCCALLHDTALPCTRHTYTHCGLAVVTAGKEQGLALVHHSAWLSSTARMSYSGHCSSVHVCCVLCLSLQGKLKVHSWRLDSQDKQTLAITGLFSIQAVSDATALVLMHTFRQNSQIR